MTQHTVFHAAKGGQGVTTSACAYALTIASAERKVLLVGNDDTLACLGFPSSDVRGFEIKRGSLDYISYTEVAGRDWRGKYSDVVWDIASDEQVPGRSFVYDGENPRFVLVTRPCYLALRRYTAQREAGVVHQPDCVLLVEESGRSLDADDVANIIDRQVASVPCDPSISRAVDAGLLASRVPLKAAKAARQLDAVLWGAA